MLVAEIDREFEKFADEKRGLRRPDFYCLASNIRLSAGAMDADGKGEGGVDRVMRHLHAKATELGISDVHLWHADVLSSLLDAHPGVRTTFDFWVQPGDVLARILREMEGPDQEEVLVPYLRRSLRYARDVKTQDIGQAAGRTVMLDEVFVDLPIDRAQTRWATPDFDVSEGHRPVVIEPGEVIIEMGVDFEAIRPDDDRQCVLSELMYRASQKFDLQGEQAALDHCDDRDSHETVLANRFVLLGGPGQGKSTVGQFLAQLCRARLLSTLGVNQSVETNQAIEAILSCANAEDIPLVGPPRYPFHIELPRYADALRAAEQDGRGLSIFSYIAQDISKTGDRRVNATMLRGWLGQLPSVLILDGLDEVPRSGNREAVIKAIEDLLDNVQEINADSLIFCTSRPQGYRQELSPKLWAHWHLEELGGDDALHLATRVAAVLVAQETRREEILVTLRAAAEDHTTAPLMISPLQVMLLFQLVATHNNIPKDRWTLFHRHYETLRDREIAKGGATGTTIGEHRSQIDSIHFNAGYLLHLRAERAGGADSYFTEEEFEQLVADQLERDGYEAEAVTLAPVIAKLATDRLVFLRSHIGGQIAFDVRSLQEFMAAARLTASPEAKIVDRLRSIAGRSHWLHVFKIACSKIYGSNAHEALRQPVIALLDSLDEGDRCHDDRLLKTGARLAMQLLGDGAAANLPIYRRQLMVRALRFLLCRDMSAYEGLFSALDFRQVNVLEPILLELLNGGEVGVRDKILRLLARICESGQEPARAWAQSLFFDRLPSEPKELLAVLDGPDVIFDHPDLRRRLVAAQYALPPGETLRWIGELFSDEEETPFPADILVCGAFLAVSTAIVKNHQGDETDLALRYRSIGRFFDIYIDCGDLALHPGWAAFFAAGKFVDRPGVDTAVHFLESIGPHLSHWNGEDQIFPWILQELLRHAHDSGGVARTIDALRRGEFGDGADWYAAESRWEKHGLKSVDLLASATAGEHLPQWSDVGAPRTLLVGPLRSGATAGDILVEISRATSSGWISRLLLSYCGRGAILTAATIANFLEDVDPIPLCKTIVMWRIYTRAIARVMVRTYSPALFTRLLFAIDNTDILPTDIIGQRERLADAYRKDENKRNLLAAIAVGGNLRRMPKALPDLPASAFEFEENDTPRTRHAVALLRAAQGLPNAAAPGSVQAWLGPSQLPFSASLTELSRGRYGDIGSETVVAVCREALLRPSVPRTARCYDRLLEIVEARPVDFAAPEKAEQLGLPAALAERSTTKTLVDMD